MRRADSARVIVGAAGAAGATVSPRAGLAAPAPLADTPPPSDTELIGSRSRSSG